MNENHTPLEELIRQSLHDEIPSAVEEKMNMQINDFIDQHHETGQASIPDFRWLQPFLEWFSKPAVSFSFTAVLFACMLTLTAFMHISPQKNALATTIGTIQLMANVFTAIDSAESFGINELSIEHDEFIYTNTIQWSKGISRIDFHNNETWLMHEGTTEIHYPGKQNTSITPLHETISLFASPERIKTQIMGKWSVIQQNNFDQNSPLEILIENMREGYTIQLWVDPNTHLPTRIQTSAAERPGGGIIQWQNIHMDFSWNQPEDSSTLQSITNSEGEQE